MGKSGKKRGKKDLPVLGSDTDFLSVFLEEERPGDGRLEKGAGGSSPGAVSDTFSDKQRTNRHGLPFIEDYESRFLQDENGVDENWAEPADPGRAADPQEDLAPEAFARLLDASFKKVAPARHTPKPMPLKRRLKRYPAPEADLDLHGFTAIGAEIKARSFITGAKQQGYFTVRIVVGRGLHSEDGPVLPQVVEDLLKTLKKENMVLAYNWEGKKKGRSGALIVYLKQFRD